MMLRQRLLDWWGRSYHRHRRNVIEAALLKGTGPFFFAAPDSNQLQVGMGWCYLRLGQKDDARAAFQRAAKLGPDNEIVREGLRLAGL